MTGRLIAALETFILRTNVKVEEVEPVSFDTLVGVGEIARTLHRTVLLPMTQPALARELGLTPKRGVLLHGEPGSGKTTIGRALAHAMKGKFLMIDGTFVPNTSTFELRVDAVLAAAEAASPCVLFIDDADVIFRNGQQPGFARKLLSKLDGLEGATQANVCIVMTAMDVADMPPALLRSGRVEVWLEMKLPDGPQRLTMMQSHAASLPAGIGIVDGGAIVAATEGFTPADLRGLVADARGRLAFDRHKQRPEGSWDDYLIAAATEMAERKRVVAALRE